jgi:hypothetical protein
LPFFRVVIREDPYLTALHVRGQIVAHFPSRKAAAGIIARITGRPAAYLGLGGEELDSAAVPEKPYEKQHELIARFELGRIEAARFAGRPERDREWARVGAYDDILRHLAEEEQFGQELKTELLAESRRRGLAEALQAAGFSFWRK